MAESEEELRSLLRASLILNIQKTKIMAYRWGKLETVAEFIFLGSKITVDGDCSHDIKRRLLLGRKAMNNLRQHIKKQRHYFANKCPSSQCYDCPVVMYGCMS